MSSWQDWFGGAVTGSLGGAVTDAVDDLLVVDADEVRAIARCWEVTADEVGGMTFDPPRRVTGTSSRVIAALHVAGDSAAAAADMLATQLRSTAAICRNGVATLSATDESVCLPIVGLC
ncbi:hypothetical protein [Gordonia sp. (in: high G+C Gram-positive bacteria)]|jgi:hypothetical protein|uniref:hypothetical protein n=1 Tax=Gordonia sp. (in: high G+C Gram-positive bacteria) TaxID=84139 RepID=UPI001D8859AB|nr:hypothetical protein [Gordonia sp. (in: high G+C Gram-positive bacteria)]MCB1294077.1 hypothetical protein [Gordonia sp. (in: high G+C Gram-positive bacteria)]HMS76037.1 hypothetical protein [Gordonia sp. (in: high G+C Gram-positive bacteria)]